MLLRPSLRCHELVCSGRSLFGWILLLVAGTLVVTAFTLSRISILTERFPPARDRVDIHSVKSNLQNSSSSCQRLSHPPAFSENLLDVASKIYVISLPRRTDRRFQMDRLKDALHLNWTYRNACEANASIVTTIMRQVHVLRSQLSRRPKLDAAQAPNDAVFDWPRDIEDAICSQETLKPSGADLWTLPSSRSSSDPFLPAEMADPYYAFTHSQYAEGGVSSHPAPLACTSRNNVFAAFSPNLPVYRRLTAAKVACWYSHFQTIREIADGKDDAVLILEDDVDIERDVTRRLEVLFDALPNDWDIVYLGHCWSNESRLPPLRNVSLRAPSGRTTPTALHPAIAHLRYPPFAYSRAIDQALAWLVESRRLRAFSVVPPVVIQRKIALSDVMPGVGSTWRDELYDGVLGSVNDQSKGPS
ncbi:hypothetical protein F5148DRAFT_1159171 [Russula earlei]|uniref:Uncharacterized protein n=1 Tax=Russula earlei TaxID=71964 RepID=A0ACC0UNC9_9AGAM|nr:hypothetical protein F5148DRAFT_1159171 [Russula earlei]